MTDCGAGMADPAGQLSLEEALDRHPCKHCGGHYNDHENLSEAEIWDARDQGCVVEKCEKRKRWTVTEETCPAPPVEEKVFFCLVIIPPADPCDVDFMREIST
jgi:hypothetical protein